MPDKLQVTIPVATIKVDGKSAGVAERDLEEIVIDTTYNLPAMASIRLHDPKKKWMESETFKLGAQLSIMLAPPKSMGKIEPAEVFVGEIVALEPSFSALGTHTLLIRAYDLSHRLHVGTKTRTFLKQKDSDIAKKIAQEAGIQVGNVTTTAVQHEYVIQANMTDFEFLALRARRSGCLFSVTQGKLNFQKPDSMKTGPVLEMGESLRQFSVRMSSARQAQTIRVTGWDFRKKQEFESTSTPKTTWNQNGIGKPGGEVAKSAIGVNGTLSLSNMVPQVPDEATAIAESVAAFQEGHFIEADGVAFGNPALVAGVQVELKFLGKKYSGKYYVTSATHIYNTAGYETHFTVTGGYPQTFDLLLTGQSAGAPEPGTIHGVVIGTVTNVKDPEGLGRVKVKYPWLDQTVESNWARIASPMAGKERGFYYLPEVDDEVLLAFEHGNPAYPYVVGMLWNGKDIPPEKNEVAHTSEGTIHRMLVTRSGHSIVFDDSNSNKSILIQDATKKQSIFFDSANSVIDIRTNGDMTIGVTGNLNISVGGNFEIETRGTYQLKARQVGIESNTNLKLDAKAVLEMKGASMAVLESSASVSVKGNAAVTVQGNPIMLN
jgi:phage protein D